MLIYEHLRTHGGQPDAYCFLLNQRLTSIPFT